MVSVYRGPKDLVLRFPCSLFDLVRMYLKTSGCMVADVAAASKAGSQNSCTCNPVLDPPLAARTDLNVVCAQYRAFAPSSPVPGLLS